MEKAEMAAAKADISRRHNIPEDSLEYLAKWDMPEIGKHLHLYNVNKPGDARHGSTLAYRPPRGKIDP